MDQAAAGKTFELKRVCFVQYNLQNRKPVKGINRFVVNVHASEVSISYVAVKFKNSVWHTINIFAANQSVKRFTGFEKSFREHLYDKFISRKLG